VVAPPGTGYGPEYYRIIAEILQEGSGPTWAAYGPGYYRSMAEEAEGMLGI
jgi:hypothetical protein